MFFTLNTYRLQFPEPKPRNYRPALGLLKVWASREEIKLNTDIFQIIQYSKYVQQPYNYDNYNDRVQNAFNGSLHGNERVDKPEDDSNSNQYKDDGKKWHKFLI